jgi:hypothetical protein
MGLFRRFVPPIEKDGKLIGGVVEFSGFPRALDADDYQLVTGLTIAGTQDNGDGTWDVWFEGGIRTCSKTEVQGAGNSYERRYNVLMGANAVISHPALDPFSSVDELARADGFPLDRAAPGHRLVFVQGDSQISSEIIAVRPMGRARAAVNWNPDSAQQPFVQVMVNQCNVTAIDQDGNIVTKNNVWLDSEGGTIRIGHAETGIWTDTEVLAGDGSTTAAMSEKQFDEDEPSYYPPDAEFSASSLEYHYNDYGVIRYGTKPMADGGYDRLQCVYWVTWDTNKATSGTVGQVAGLSPTSGDIPENGDTIDNVIGVWRSLPAGDFDLTFYVVSGVGGFELRGGPIGGSSPCGGFLFDDSVIGDYYSRGSQGGAIATLPITTSGSYTGLFQVRAYRNGTSIILYHRQNDADSWKIGCSWTAGNSDQAMSVGFISWGAETLKVFAGLDGTFDFSRLGSGAGTTGMRRVTTINVANFDSYQLASTTAITEVKNLSTGETMSLVSSTFDRTKYGYSATSPPTVYFYAESAGDRIQVTQAAATGSSSAPGEAPRTSNITDLATEGSSVTSENRGNAYDVAVIRWPHGGDPPGAGVSAEVWADCRGRNDGSVFLWYDIKNDDDTDWAKCDSDQCPFQIVPGGQFFLSQEFLDSIGNSQVCWAMGGTSSP